MSSSWWKAYENTGYLCGWKMVVNPSGEARLSSIGNVCDYYTGNEKTGDYVIRRAESKPGDVLNIKSLNQGLRRVLMLGHFDRLPVISRIPMTLIKESGCLCDRAQDRGLYRWSRLFQYGGLYRLC